MLNIDEARPRIYRLALTTCISVGVLGAATILTVCNSNVETITPTPVVQTLPTKTQSAFASALSVTPTLSQRIQPTPTAPPFTNTPAEVPPSSSPSPTSTNLSPTNTPLPIATATPSETPTATATTILAAASATKARPTLSPDQKFGIKLANLADLVGISGNADFAKLLKAGDLQGIEDQKLGVVLRNEDASPAMIIVTSGDFALFPDLASDYKKAWEYLKANAPDVAAHMSGDWNVQFISGGAKCNLDGQNPCVFNSGDARVSSSLPGTGLDNNRGNGILVNVNSDLARSPGMALSVIVTEGIQGVASTGLKGQPETAWDPWNGYKVRLAPITIDGTKIENVEWYSVYYAESVQLPAGPEATDYANQLDQFATALANAGIPKN